MSMIESWVYALWKELQDHKGKVTLAFAAITCAVVVVGFLWPKKYEAATIVFADEQNIIKPLLSGSAEVTKPDTDQEAIARDRILSNKVLAQAVVLAKKAKPDADEATIDPLVRQLRGSITVTEAGKGHLRIAYQSKSPNNAFVMASAVTNAFIQDSSQTKRQESREAFTFIDNQVKTYKEQLQTAEDRLKTFKGGSGAITGGSTQINQLRGELSQLTLDLQVARVRRDEMRRQLSQEKQFVGRQYRSDTFRQRMAQAQAQLDTLRLSYSETYPDIISLKQQIQDLERAVRESENSTTNVDSQNEGVNPVYAKLRGDLADAEVSVRGLELKVATINKMLDDEQNYSKRGAEFEAQLAELTRDYDVTKKMYESMLERKERARLSVALDVEGQGVSYKIKDPAVFPTVPVGLRFMHFFMLAPIAGLLVPLACLAAFIQLDPHIRFLDRLEMALPENIPVMAVIPHMVTLSERRAGRSEWFGLAIFAGIVLLVYVAFGALRFAEVI